MAGWPVTGFERSQLYRRVGSRMNQKVFNRFCSGSELRIERKAAWVDSGAMPCGVNAGNAEWKLRLLAADEGGKRAADVAVSNQCEAQRIIVALAARNLADGCSAGTRALCGYLRTLGSSRQKSRGYPRATGWKPENVSAMNVAQGHA